MASSQSPKCSKGRKTSWSLSAQLTHSQMKQATKSIPGQERTCQFIHYLDEGVSLQEFLGIQSTGHTESDAYPRAQMVHCPVCVNAILISIRERQIRFSFNPEHITISPFPVTINCMQLHSRISEYSRQHLIKIGIAPSHSLIEIVISSQNFYSIVDNTCLVREKVWVLVPQHISLLLNK